MEGKVAELEAVKEEFQEATSELEEIKVAMEVFDDSEPEEEESADAGKGAQKAKAKAKGKGGAQQLKEKIDSLQQMIALHAEESGKMKTEVEDLTYQLQEANAISGKVPPLEEEIT